MCIEEKKLSTLRLNLFCLFVSLGLEENLVETSLVLKGEKEEEKKCLTIHHTMPNNRAVDSETQKVGYW